MPGHSVPLAALGGFILIFGFFAFNGGSQVRLSIYQYYTASNYISVFSTVSTYSVTMAIGGFILIFGLFAFKAGSWHVYLSISTNLLPNTSQYLVLYLPIYPLL